MHVRDRYYLDEPITWRKTTDPEYPYETNHASHTLTVRLNDFPQEHLYTLIVDSKPVTSFDDWPDTWTRDDSESLDNASFKTEAKEKQRRRIV